VSIKLAPVLAIFLAFAARLPASAGPSMLFDNVGDYSYSWWANGIRDSALLLRFQTSRYALEFDVPAFKLPYLAPITSDALESDLLTQDDDREFGRPDASLTCAIHILGRTYQAIGASAKLDDCNLIESGKFFQRREITGIQWQQGCPTVKSSLEIAAWPDRLTLLLRATPGQAIPDADLELNLSAPPAFVVAPFPSNAVVIENDLHNQWSVRLRVGEWKAGDERVVALVISRRSKPDQGEIKITADQITPKAAPLEVTYDAAMGWHRIDLRNDLTGQPPYNDRIERVKLTIDNPSTSPRIVRLCFAKGLPREGGVFGITGISAILRDTDGSPLGIPIQLSKNWHTNPGRYMGPWYRGLTMLTVPPRQKIELEYTSVNALWGGVPAASHAQLCLVGWGSNQLWEEAAIGSWGESICFEPDQAQAGAAVLDTRPLMVWAMGKQPKTKWDWTANVGGADFLGYYDLSGKRQWNSRMKAMRRRTGPVLTDAVYVGESRDGTIRLRYSAGLYRTNDIMRGMYRFRYDVRKPTPLGRLVFFQCGSENYTYTSERKFAYGNENGLVKEWDTTWGGNTYRGIAFPVMGRVPWFSMHEAVSRAEGKEAWANRGIVIRKWEAKLGGKMVGPWAAERGVEAGHGGKSSVIDILPPPYLKALQPGDYVECEIEHVVVPQFADDYHGPNENLRAALAKDQNTWKMICREAVGNDLSVRMTLGKLIRTRPTTIQAFRDRAEFTITGGLGYAPITITGLSNYRTPILEVKEGDEWTTVDQSVYGKDYWQTDYNPETRTWEITYSIPMDTPDDQRITRSFRFRLSAFAPVIPANAGIYLPGVRP